MNISERRPGLEEGGVRRRETGGAPGEVAQGLGQLG